MCDHDDFDAFARLDAMRPGMTRRRFGLMGLGASLAAALPPALGADAGPAAGKDVDIALPDSLADGYFVHPAEGRHPGVLIWPDIFGVRPAFRQMADRLAAAGYSVLVVNPFHRARRTPASPPRAGQVDPAMREYFIRLKDSLAPATIEEDARAFVAFLDAQPSVDPKRRIGSAGYCMGGPLVLRTAAAVPERIGAGASFHGAGLATGAPDSPHRLIPKTKAAFLVAIAENDDAKEPGAKDVLRQSFAQVGRPAEIEVYAAQHGWCPPDSRVHHPELAQRAWDRMLDLFGRSLAA